MFTIRKTLAATAFLSTAIVLAGCGSAGINVVDPEGVGLCNGTEAVSLQVTQDTAGEVVTIEYDGPSDVSIVAFQGLYSDTNFFELFPAKAFAFGYPVDEPTGSPDLAFTALDTESAPWDIAPFPGGIIHATYEAPIDEFVADLAYNAETEDAANAMWDRLLPVTIGVICESGFTSRLVDSPTLDSDMIYGGVELAVAQAFYPNFMYIDPPSVNAVDDIRHGVSGTMTFPDELADALPDDFVAETMSASAVYLGERDPMLPPTDEYPYTLDGVDLGDMFFIPVYLAIGGGSTVTFNFPNELSVSEPIDFEFTGETEAPQDGYYLFFLTVGDDSENLSNFKIVTSILQYSDNRGITFDEFRANPKSENLAPTGGDPNVIIWALVGGLVVIAAVMLRPKRRRVQDDSTIDPSDRNE